MWWSIRGILSWHFVFSIFFLKQYLVVNQEIVLLSFLFRNKAFHTSCFLLQCSLLSHGGDASDKHITLLMNAGLLVSNFLITFHGIIVMFFLCYVTSSNVAMKEYYISTMIGLMFNCISTIKLHLIWYRDCSWPTMCTVCPCWFFADAPAYRSKHVLVFYSKSWSSFERPIPGCISWLFCSLFRIL